MRACLFQAAEIEDVPTDLREAALAARHRFDKARTRTARAQTEAEAAEVVKRARRDRRKPPQV